MSAVELDRRDQSRATDREAQATLDQTVLQPQRPIQHDVEWRRQPEFAGHLSVLSCPLLTPAGSSEQGQQQADEGSREHDAKAGGMQLVGQLVSTVATHVAGM